MPIIEEVNKVLFEDKPAKEAVNDLMLRDKKWNMAILAGKIKNAGVPYNLQGKTYGRIKI